MKKFFHLLDSYRDLRHSIHSVLSSSSLSVRLFYFLNSAFTDIIFLALFLSYILALGIVEFPAQLNGKVLTRDKNCTGVTGSNPVAG